MTAQEAMSSMGAMPNDTRARAAELFDAAFARTKAKLGRDASATVLQARVTVLAQLAGFGVEDDPKDKRAKLIIRQDETNLCASLLCKGNGIFLAQGGAPVTKALPGFDYKDDADQWEDGAGCEATAAVAVRVIELLGLAR